MPKGLIYAAVILMLLALVPPALIARQRAITFSRPRIHIIQDMDAQIRILPQQASDLFLDGRGMRPPVDGAIARGDLVEDDHFHKGVSGGQWATRFPRQVTVDLALLRRGRERFEIFCQPCHGMAGYGDGIVNQRAMQLMDAPMLGNGTTWVQPKSVHEEAIRAQPPGQIFNSITNGIRNMAGYEAQIPTEDRWAIVAYVKALQRSQHADPADLTPQQRARLGAEIPADQVAEQLLKRLSER